MTESDLLEEILDRLGRAKSSEAIFGMDDAADWPDGTLDRLTKAGLVKRAQPAKSIECKGCERYCFMPVHSLPAEGNRRARAFISCDKPEDFGRIPVELRRLTQWKVTGGALADTVAGLLGFAKPAQDDYASGKRWKLGVVNGKERKGEVKLAVENGVMLILAGHTIPLSEVLTLDGGCLSIDRDELRRLVDKPNGQSGAHHHAPSNVRREARKLDTQKEYEAWQKAYRALKRKHPEKSDVWCSQQISRTDNPKGRDAETIRKHMRK
jgi:hypothetical protein